MGKVAADALPLPIGVPSGLVGARMRVAESDMVMDESHDRIDAVARRGDIGKFAPGDAYQPVNLAISATKQVDEDIIRKPLDRGTAVSGARTSSNPLSSITKSANRITPPAGTISRVQMFPKLS